MQGGSSILLIIHVITDRTEQHKVLSPINPNYYKISETNWPFSGCMFSLLKHTTTIVNKWELLTTAHAHRSKEFRSRLSPIP